MLLYGSILVCWNIFDHFFLKRNSHFSARCNPIVSNWLLHSLPCICLQQIYLFLLYMWDYYRFVNDILVTYIKEAYSHVASLFNHVQIHFKILLKKHTDFRLLVCVVQFCCDLFLILLIWKHVTSVQVSTEFNGQYIEIFLRSAYNTICLWCRPKFVCFLLHFNFGKAEQKHIFRIYIGSVQVVSIYLLLLWISLLFSGLRRQFFSCIEHICHECTSSYMLKCYT